MPEHPDPFEQLRRPIAPLAPALFSTITGWPSFWERYSPWMRANESVRPPAGYAQTILIGFDGHVCVHPLSGCEKAIVAAPVAMKPRRVIFNAMTTSQRASGPKKRVVGALLPVP